MVRRPEGRYRHGINTACGTKSKLSAYLQCSFLLSGTAGSEGGTLADTLDAFFPDECKSDLLIHHRGAEREAGQGLVKQVSELRRFMEEEKIPKPQG